MARTVSPAKTPGVAIARILRGYGLTQGPGWQKDFSILPVMGSVHNGRIGTWANVRSTEGHRIVAENADAIEAAADESGWPFRVSLYATSRGTLDAYISNTGPRHRETTIPVNEPNED